MIFVIIFQERLTVNGGGGDGGVNCKQGNDYFGKNLKCVFNFDLWIKIFIHSRLLGARLNAELCEALH